MDNQQQPAKKIILNYGLILGAITVLISVAIFAMGMQYDQDWKTGSISFLATAVIIFLGIKKIKENSDGNLTLGQAIKTGLGIALIGGIISILYTVIYMNYIDPDFVTNTMDTAEQKMLDQNPNLSDEQIEQALSITKKLMSPAIMSAFALVWTLFIGFIISLISGLILKNDPNK